jgi:hypothetical protein
MSKGTSQGGATFIKFRGEMTHIWQGLRSGLWLTAARAAVTGRFATRGIANATGLPLGLTAL